MDNFTKREGHQEHNSFITEICPLIRRYPELVKIRLFVCNLFKTVV